MTIRSRSRLSTWNLLGGLLLLAQVSMAQLPAADTLQTSNGNLIVQPIFHGALVLRLNDRTIYIDPYGGVRAYSGLPAPDLILVTDIHQDHLDTATLYGINTNKARLVVPKAVAERLASRFNDRTRVLNNGMTVKEFGISITAIPMYNLPEEPQARHTKGRGNGYLIEWGGKKIYVSGDTEDIPEMRALSAVDVAFLCMNQPFTMTIQQAASAVLEFKPRVVYPYHYRDANGFSDVEGFKKLVAERNPGIEVRIRNWYGRRTQASRFTRQENVVYGMVSGAALTMDVYKPVSPNRIGIIAIPGTAYGYAYSADYGQASITSNFARDTVYFGRFAKTLVERGYTVFVLNHRLAPAHRYKDITGDCQRAVRYVRFHGKEFAIDPNQLGALGYSSGATLCAMLGVTDWDRPATATGVDAVSSKVQSVVTLAARFDLSDFNKAEDTNIQNAMVSRVLLNYMGELPMVGNGEYTLAGKYAEASPIAHVDKEDASFLIYASHDDPLVPQRQEGRMYRKLLENQVDARLNMLDKQGHNPIPNMDEVDKWFLDHLGGVNNSRKE